MKLTPKQLLTFRQTGYLVIENFISKSICETLMNRIHDIIQENKSKIPYSIFESGSNEHACTDYFLDSGDKIHFFFEPQSFNTEGQPYLPIEKSLNKIGHALHERDPIFADHSKDNRLEEMASDLGLMKPTIVQSMYIFKQPNIGAEVQCHQDSTYLHVEGSDVIGFWFALEDATLENGCLEVIPNPIDLPLHSKMIRDGKKIFFETYQEKTPWEEANALPLEVTQGTLVILHGRVPHKSKANHSAKSRHAYTLHVIDSTYPYPSTNWLQR